MYERMDMNDRMDEVFNRRARPRDLCDSDRNIMRELRHEGCEDGHCEECGACIEPDFTDFVFLQTGDPLCCDCAPHAYRECPCAECVARSNREDGCP